MRPSRRSLTVLMATALATSVAAPVAAARADEQTKTVSYHGYQIQIPDDWKVVDLARDPRACVRYDRPAVYLGTAGKQTDCPAGLMGRTAGIHLEPITAATGSSVSAGVTRTPAGDAAPARPSSKHGQIQYVVEAAGLLVTAAHTSATEQSVRDVLGDARLTASARRTPFVAKSASPAAQAVGPQPGTYTGEGFDACQAPAQGAMDDWKASSPYSAVGIYISGDTRACEQPNLTADWVTAQTAAGWHLIPIEVGKQASCSRFSNRMSSDPVVARTEGSDAARGSVQAAQSLGIPTGSVLYNDIEQYPSDPQCKDAFLSYLSGWTDTLHEASYLSGVYSSASSGIADAASETTNPSYTVVDQIWFAWWNEAHDTAGGRYVGDDQWALHQRIHQYQGGHDETYGSTTINIDGNYLDVAAPQ
ncbi:DUF1906 domain-containing protein [Luteipulveratus mongoliensis]|uniref:DUF1906 domain-containing protein n=1 Tax=Luteipulveratus mongoliensis TaxID=571913 RepID=UPI000697BE50|nr:DUF1906 domain-containing protein [Luteipulveratus mongoliensis]